MARAHLSRSDVRRIMQRGHLVTVPRGTDRRGVPAPAARTDVLDRPVTVAERPPHHEVMEERFGLRPSPNERTYVGTRLDIARYAHRETRVLVIDSDDTIRPLRPVTLHPPMGFDWGAVTSGARDLGLAILADAIDEEFAHEWFIAYTQDVIAQIRGDHFVLRLSDVHEWQSIGRG